MQTRTITLNKGKENEKDFTFICASRSNRSGFVHECELHIGFQTFECKAQYYNRTWECYTYQSVMKGALHNYKEYVLNHLKEKFLEERGYSRMTPKLRVDFDVLCAENSQLTEIETVNKELDHNSSWW